jgi:hypothetical protein
VPNTNIKLGFMQDTERERSTRDIVVEISKVRFNVRQREREI